MPVDADQSRCNFDVGVGGMRCANGETWEFWLTFDGKRATNDVGIFRSVHVGDSISAHATGAFFDLVTKRLALVFKQHQHTVTPGEFWTDGPSV